MALSAAWWEQEDRESQDALNGLKSRFESASSQASVRTELDTFFESLYYDRTYAGFVAGESTIDLLVGTVESSLRENVIQRIVSAFASKLSRQRNKPVMLTDGADWRLQRKAKKLEKWIWGQLQACRINEVMRDSDTQMLLKGTGIIYTGSRRDEIYCDVVPPNEIKVSTAAAMRGDPRDIYREQVVDRRRLMKLYPEKADEIEKARALPPEVAFLATGEFDTDMVRTITGWRLPSYEEAEDGGTIVAVENVVLSASEWCRPRFPFAVSRFMLAPAGWFGIGLVQALVAMQLELNRLNADKSDAMHLLSAPFVLAPTGSFVASHFSNEIGRLLEYNPSYGPPQVVTPSPISPVMFEHCDRVKSGMFAQSGLSEMATQGFKPAGLNSAPSLRAYADMIDDSIHDIFLRREQMILDVAENIICEAEEMLEGEHRPKRAKYTGPRGITYFDFEDVKMAREEYTLTMKAASDLSTTLAGKLEDLEELRSLGIVTDPAEMQELIQMPDLDTAASRRNSMRELLLQTIEDKILEEGIAICPEPTWDLKLAMKLCMATRWRAQLMTNVPEGRIALLRRFEKNCAYYILTAQGQPADAATYEMPQQVAEQPPLDMGMAESPMGAMTLPTDVQPGAALSPEGATPAAIG
jgi:hypothetical protein